MSVIRGLAHERASSTRTSSGSRARVWAPHLGADAREAVGAAGCGAAGAGVDLDLIRWR